jgi:hypothetical protein
MQNEIPDIFTTEVISTAVDVFWQQDDQSALLAKDTLIVSNAYNPESEEEQQLLKMLSACKLTSNDYQVVKLAPAESTAWHRLRHTTQASKVLLLGVHPGQLGISALMSIHEINNFDGVQFVPTASLAELLANATLKQHLWTSVLKVIYKQ